MKRKNLILLIVLLFVFLAGLVFVYIEYNKSVTISGGLSNNKSITDKYKVDGNYKYLYFNLSIDNTKCKNSLKYSFISPNGKVELQGTVNKQDMVIIKTKKFKSIKGEWKLKIEKDYEDARFWVDRSYLSSNH